MGINTPPATPTPTVTWLLPVKDAMPYLPETLASIAAQTFRGARILAWDNGSTDGTREELHRWIGPARALDGEVVSDRPMPLGASLAQMVERTNTPWCARIDGDDINEPERLARQIAWLALHPDVALVGTGISLMSRDGAITQTLPAEVTHHADVRWHLRFGNAISHPTVVFRRDAVLDVGNYRDMAPGQDYDLWCRLANRYRVANIAEPLVRYRVHDRSVTARSMNHFAETVERIQTENLAALWPGLTVTEWRRLRDQLGQRATMPITVADCLRLRAVATRAAVNAGESPDYFRWTRRYRDRSSNLWTRWLKQRVGVNLMRPAFRPRRAPALPAGFLAGAADVR